MELDELAALEQRTAEPMFSWLCTVAGNLLIDRGRRAWMRAGVVSIPDGWDMPDHRPDFTDGVVRQLDAHVFFKLMLHRLSDKQERTVRLRLRGYSFERVATEMGLSLGSAKKLHQRGVVSLRRAYHTAA